MAKFASLFLIVAFHTILAASNRAKISPRLQTSLPKFGSVDILVSFGGIGNALSQVSSLSFPTRESRLLAVSDSLKQHTGPVQAKAYNLLTKQKSVQKVVSLWVTNQIFVKGASADTVEALAELDEVSYIQEDEHILLEDTVAVPAKSPRNNSILAEWGVDAIRAPQVWALSGGNSGQGVIVATIDTGVRQSHEALRNNYAGLWHDAVDGNANPIDLNGHGTHTTGSIVGAGGIGVAPGARWIACRACGQISCPNSALIECGQWVICPSTNCVGAPDVVSNSWGGGRGQTFYDGVIRAWHAAGITPLFSNGNSGSGCNTANSPADSQADVLGIGGTASNGGIYASTSRGPSIFGGIKPDIAAPGQSVVSAYYTSDTAYATLSGTSMACPHAAGVVALLKSHTPRLTYAQIKNLLLQNADTNLIAPGQNCGAIPDSQYPNHSYGVGEVDALNSFNALVNGRF